MHRLLLRCYRLFLLCPVVLSLLQVHRLLLRCYRLFLLCPAMLSLLQGHRLLLTCRRLFLLRLLELQHLRLVVLGHDITIGSIEVTPWTPQYGGISVTAERLVHIEITGLPCHMYAPPIMEYILSPFGLVETHDQRSSGKEKNRAILLLHTLLICRADTSPFAAKKHTSGAIATGFLDNRSFIELRQIHQGDTIAIRWNAPTRRSRSASNQC